MEKYFILKLIVIFFFLDTAFQLPTRAQDSLYIPRDIKKAYTNGTRSFDGKPGPKYWENFADYKINVEIDTSTRSIIGEENINYRNNSPDTLKQIVFRLYQNLYRKGEARDFPVDTTDLTDGVNIKELKINGKNININSHGFKFFLFGTNMIVKLDTPFLPQQSLEIGCKWSFIMPLKTDIRMGMIDSTSYYVGYWYPQISVYDDIDGWDLIQYTGRQEFYNNFGNFDVEITVPKNYIVWATGILQNPEDVLTKKYLERRKAAESSDSVIHIITEDDLNNGDITADNIKNTWHFKAENVTDFAFASSDHYLWDEGSLVVDNKTGRRAIVAAAYRKQALDFPAVAKIGIESIEHYSKKLPGIPFPFPKVTVVNGARGGGMEYPMMVNDYSAYSLSRTVGVTAHEIAHMYFPFYTGTNETKYAWMDEGWATTLPVGIEFHSVKEFYTIDWISKSYESLAGEEYDMPLIMPSDLLKGRSYNISSYSKAAEAYLILKDMLGDSLFTTALQGYINRWQGKHPIPYDFFYSFNNILHENLDWFWKPWFFEFGEPDLAIQNVNIEGKSVNVTIRKTGNIPVPVRITIYYWGGDQDSLYYTAAAWKGNNRALIVQFQTDKKIKEIILGDDQIPDVNKKNNFFYVKKEE